MKKFKEMALAFVTLVVSGASINARSLNGDISTDGKDPFSVRYIGHKDGYLMFQLVVNSDAHANLSFEVCDKVTGETFIAKVPHVQPVQTIKIEKRDTQELDFKLVIGEEVYSRSFVLQSDEELEIRKAA